jgi:hypothetical protein
MWVFLAAARAAEPALTVTGSVTCEQTPLDPPPNDRPAGRRVCSLHLHWRNASNRVIPLLHPVVSGRVRAWAPWFAVTEGATSLLLGPLYRLDHVSFFASAVPARGELTQDVVLRRCDALAPGAPTPMEPMAAVSLAWERGDMREVVRLGEAQGLEWEG